MNGPVAMRRRDDREQPGRGAADPDDALDRQLERSTIAVLPELRLGCAGARDAVTRQVPMFVMKSPPSGSALATSQPPAS